MSFIRRAAALVYGTVCYAIFFVTFLYLIGWLTGLVVPVSIDSGTPGSVPAAFAIDLALIALFGVQHSVMARPGFKQVLTRIVPKPIERATYVLASSIVLILLFAAWRPIPFAIWQAEGIAAIALQAGALLGFGIVLYSTFLIDHFDLFGLRQVFLAWRGRPYTEKRFVTPQTLPVHPSPAVRGLDDLVLADAGADGRARAVRERDDGLHPDRHPLRGARPERFAGRALPPVAGGHADVRPARAHAARPGAGAGRRGVVTRSASPIREGFGSRSAAVRARSARCGAERVRRAPLERLAVGRRRWRSTRRARSASPRS